MILLKKELQGKKVAYMSWYYPAKSFTLPYKDDAVLNVSIIDSLYSFRKLQCILDQKEIDPKTKELKGILYNPYDRTLNLENATFYVGYMNGYKQMKVTKTLQLASPLPSNLKSLDSIAIRLQLKEEIPENFSFLRIGISENGLYPGLNSQPYPINGANK